MKLHERALAGAKKAAEEQREYIQEQLKKLLWNVLHIPKEELLNVTDSYTSPDGLTFICESVYYGNYNLSLRAIHGETITPIIIVSLNHLGELLNQYQYHPDPEIYFG